MEEEFDFHYELMMQDDISKRGELVIKFDNKKVHWLVLGNC